MGLALGTLDADDEHVFRQPALVARLPARDTQRMAFLAEQRVAAISRADALDRQILREMHDQPSFGIEIADRVQPTHECPVALDALQRRRAHARHDPHVEHDVRAVGDLHAAPRVGRPERSHAVRHDVHRPPAHASLEQRIDLAMCLGRIHPVVVRTRVLALAGADIGQVLDPGDVGGVRAVQIAVRVGLLVERDQVATRKHELDQRIAFGLRPVAPLDPVRTGQLCDIGDPVSKCGVGGRHRPRIPGVPVGPRSRQDATGRAQGGSGIIATRLACRADRSAGKKKAPSDEGAIRGRTVNRACRSVGPQAAAFRDRVALRRVAFFAFRRRLRTGAGFSAASVTRSKVSVARSRISRPALVDDLKDASGVARHAGTRRGQHLDLVADQLDSRSRPARRARAAARTP